MKRPCLPPVAKKVHIPHVVFVTADDWEGLYIDGQLVTEGHEVRRSELLRILGIPHKELNADADWLAERGCFPTQLLDVKLGK